MSTNINYDAMRHSQMGSTEFTDKEELLGSSDIFTETASLPSLSSSDKTTSGINIYSRKLSITCNDTKGLAEIKQNEIPEHVGKLSKSSKALIAISACIILLTITWIVVATLVSLKMIKIPDMARHMALRIAFYGVCGMIGISAIFLSATTFVVGKSHGEKMGYKKCLEDKINT